MSLRRPHPPALLTRVFGIAICLALGLSHPGVAADPFHERLLEDGIMAYRNGEHAFAAKSLRLACFGLLDEPKVLARGLTFLALAQAESDDEAAFAETFSRILEVEQRFLAFSALDLDAGTRSAFDGHLERWIAPDLLDRVPAFRRVARLKREARLLELAPEERRMELERWLTAEPDNSTWRLLLAELELERGAFDAALKAAEEVLARKPELERARCLRGRAGAATGACEQALVDLETCREPSQPLALVESRLRCLVRLGDWQQASALLAEVPSDRQKRAPFKQLVRDVRKGRKAAAKIPDTTQEAPSLDAAEEPVAPEAREREESVATTEPDAPPETGAGSSRQGEPDREEIAAEPQPEALVSDDPSTWPAELRDEIERARRLVPSASRAELTDVLADLRELADRYRQLSEPQHLAAEIAYRLSRWQEAVSFFERGGEPGPNHPDRLFYLSVALYETGDHAEARRVLERCLPSLEMTELVRAYAGEILGDDLEAQSSQGTW